MYLIRMLFLLTRVNATFRIPLHESSMIDMTVFRGESGESMTRQFQISLSTRTVVIVNATDEPFSAISLFLNNQGALYTDENFLTAYWDETPGNRDRVAIGHRSWLLRSFDAISIHRTLFSGPDYLVLGDTQDSFEASCVPGSLMDARNAFVGDYRVPATMAWLPYDMIATVPESLFLGMVDSLVRYGAIRVNAGVYRSVFQNCTVGNLEHLPPFELNFIAGRVILEPIDYVRLDATAASCEIRVTRGGPRGYTINPIMIPGVNVKVTVGGMTQICDAL